MRQKADRFHKLIGRIRRSGKRQKLTMISAVFIVYVLLLSGIFAYFHSEDEVTNKFQAKNAAVKLLEPDWDSVGQDQAKASEPGMTILKDPYAKNEGQNDLYIRLKMTVSLGRFDGDGRYPEYVADLNDNARRLNSILNAIEMKKGSTTSALLGWAQRSGDISGWVLQDDCYNRDYYMENQGVQTLNDGTTEQVFYFYYITGTKDGENSVMRVVAPQESTSELFNQLQIPIYKKDYLGVFDQKYDITVEAQAVTVNPAESAAVCVQKTNFMDD